jgi:hypothetical protein
MNQHNIAQAEAHLLSAQHLDRLDQRRRYLAGRVTLKQSVGWEFTYDQSEHDALAWAIERLRTVDDRDNRQ